LLLYRAALLPRGYCSNPKIRCQSFFMLTTIHPLLFASAIRASVNVPTLDCGP
jgi:hypothetical protein